ncbi:MAG: MBL fold metallo-hydrolase [Candidatus Hermodarchaeota archaeon]
MTLKVSDKVNAIRRLFEMSLEAKEIAFIYMRYSAVILRTQKATIGIDLGKYILKKEVQAIENLDLLLHTHGHHDHFDSQTTKDIFDLTGTNVVVEPSIAENLQEIIPSDKLFSAHQDKRLQIDDFEINTVEGVHPCPISLYRIIYDQFDVFHGGDSGYIPLKEYPANLAFLPIGTPSPSCSPEIALKMAQDLNSKMVIAVHGTKNQCKKFEELAKKKMSELKVIIPNPYESLKCSWKEILME